MNIEHPQMLWWLLGLIPLAALQLYHYRRGRGDLARIAGDRRETILTVYSVKWFFSSFFFSLFCAFSILALAGFSWGQEAVEESRGGLDVVVAIDVSKSMRAADDGEESRIGRAQEIGRRLVQELQSARFGIVVFSGSALRAVPITEDRTSVESFLSALRTDVMTAEGSNLEKGLETAFAAFPEGSSRNRVVVLLSDGEQHTGNPLRPAELARRSGVPMYTVTLGSRSGSTVPLSEGGRLTDRDGNVVLSRADPDTMREIAETSGAAAFRGAQREVVAPLIEEIRGFESQRERQGFRLVSVRRYRLFVGVALIAVVLYIFVRVFRWKGVI